MNQESLRRHIRTIGHYAPGHGTIVVHVSRMATLESMTQQHDGLHTDSYQNHRHSRLQLPPVGTPCANHVDAPAMCPQAHVCECGAPLSAHLTTSANCPDAYPKHFTPNAETLTKFPEQYAPA